MVLIQDVTATRDQIVQHFLDMKHSDIITYNWGGYNTSNPNMWDVTDYTYINGIPLIIDRDIDVGYLLEVVERNTKVISYVVVAITPYGHQSAWWEHNAGTFFERTTEISIVCQWAAGVIYGLFEYIRSEHK